MGVKSIQIATESCTIYPCLMRSSRTWNIVLFDRAKHGTIVYVSSGEPNHIGERQSNFDMSSFTLYHGTVTLENE